MQDRKGKGEPRELELKLEIDPRDIGRFKAHPLFRSAGAPKQLHAVYYDTRKQALRRAGLTLRVRRDGESFLQTIKAERPGAGVALDRGEWEREVTSAEPDFGAALETPLEPLLRDGAARRKIRPAFTVAVDRLSADARRGGSKLELALDDARLEAGGRHGTFAEIELELKSGAPKALYTAALELSRAAPLRLSVRAKSARGYALAGARRPACVKAAPIVLKPGQSTAEAFQHVAHSCLRQLIENEALLREAANPDAVHQARVAVRRMRAALSVFKPIVADARMEGIKARLKEIAEPLGQARDLDVFIAKVLKPAGKDGRDRKLQELIADYESRRDAAYRTAIDHVESAEFGRSVLAVAAWVETGPWLKAAGKEAQGGEKAVESYAAVELSRRWRKVRSRLKGIDQLNEEARHRVRIEIKKLRYAAEFFSSLFEASGSGKRLRPALAAIQALQESLGDLNDIAVAREMADRAGQAGLSRDRESLVAPLLAKVNRQAAQFRKVEPFWTEAP